MRTKTHLWLGALGIVLFAIVFLVPFAFILFTAAKTQTEAGELQFSLPTTWALLQNFQDALAARDYMLVIAFINSIVLTVVSITVLVVLSAMVAHVVQRRRSRWSGVVNFLVLCGLIIPPAVVPTVWVLQSLGLFKTLSGLIFIEVAFGLAFDPFAPDSAFTEVGAEIVRALDFYGVPEAEQQELVVAYSASMPDVVTSSTD